MVNGREISPIAERLRDDGYYKHTYMCKGQDDYWMIYHEVGILMSIYNEDYKVRVKDLKSCGEVVAVVLEISNKNKL